ncbi:MAG: NgoPII family restriction endonuclease [Ignavibacteria bacterium]
MSNVLTAIKKIVENPIIEIKTVYESKNRANGVGASFEAYVKDIFAGTHEVEDENELIRIHNEIFSYGGTQNQPPDLMLRGGDAIEVKKIESISNSIALNSSYPKDKLYAHSKMINKHCKDCEVWEVKDMVYIIGCVTKNSLKSIWIVYGDCYAANNEIYEKIRTHIEQGIREIKTVEFAETKELARLNRIDPLGITNLRVRGMWEIENPRKVFKYLNPPSSGNFEFCCLMSEDKYNSFAIEDRLQIENIKSQNFKQEKVKIKNPNNSTNLINARFLTFFK